MALMAAMERRAGDVNGWLRANAWHLTTTAALLFVLAGQWQERQTNVAAEVAKLDQRVAAVESWQGYERSRLDPIYLAREVAIAQNAEILRRLSAIEEELRQMRRTR